MWRGETAVLYTHFHQGIFVKKLTLVYKYNQTRFETNFSTCFCLPLCGKTPGDNTLIERK